MRRSIMVGLWAVVAAACQEDATLPVLLRVPDDAPSGLRYDLRIHRERDATCPEPAALLDGRLPGERVYQAYLAEEGQQPSEIGKLARGRYLVAAVARDEACAPRLYACVSTEVRGGDQPLELGLKALETNAEEVACAAACTAASTCEPCVALAVGHPRLVTSLPGLFESERRGVHMLVATELGWARRRWFISQGFSPWSRHAAALEVEPAELGLVPAVAWPHAAEFQGETLLAVFGHPTGLAAASWIENKTGVEFRQDVSPGSILPLAMHTAPAQREADRPAALAIYGTTSLSTAPIVELRFDDGQTEAKRALHILPEGAREPLFGATSSLHFVGNQAIDAGLLGPASMLFLVAAKPDAEPELWLGQRDEQACADWCWISLGRPNDASLAAAYGPLALTYTEDPPGRRVVVRVFVTAQRADQRVVFDRVFDGAAWQPFHEVSVDPQPDDPAEQSSVVAWRSEGLLRLQLFGLRRESRQITELRQPFKEQWAWSEELASLWQRPVGPPSAVAHTGDEPHILVSARDESGVSLLWAHARPLDEGWETGSSRVCKPE